MTSEEAQQLINYFENAYKTNGLQLFHFMDIRNIITRFADAPPYVTPIEGGFVTIGFGEHGNHMIISTEWNDHSGKSSHAINPEQLRGLKKNIDRMLEFMNE